MPSVHSVFRIPIPMLPALLLMLPVLLSSPRHSPFMAHVVGSWPPARPGQVLLTEAPLVYIRKYRAILRLPASGGRPSCLCQGGISRTKPRSSLCPPLLISTVNSKPRTRLKAVCSPSTPQQDFLLDNQIIACNTSNTLKHVIVCRPMCRYWRLSGSCRAPEQSQLRRPRLPKFQRRGLLSRS